VLTQLVVLALFVGLAIAAAKRFRPGAVLAGTGPEGGEDMQGFSAEVTAAATKLPTGGGDLAVPLLRADGDESGRGASRPAMDDGAHGPRTADERAGHACATGGHAYVGYATTE
jgi:hypothetical protein